ncbi:MAG: DUF6687 family protein [Planctomycetota bacterium]
MSLPIRFQTEAGTAPVVSVDGAFGAPGLHLSHWPGNTTPPGLKRDLSTGIALEYARLPLAERAALAAGCEAIAVNHYDTDGLCALFAVLEPELALQHEPLLMAAAESGDRFRTPDLAGFRLDAVFLALADPSRSPLPADVFALRGAAKHSRLVDEGLRALRRVLAAGLEVYRALWEPAERALEADRRDLAAALFDDLVHLDLAVWTAPFGRGSTRSSAAGGPSAVGALNAADDGPGRVFDPGRHALFGATRADRVLALGPGPLGTTARLIIGTGSFFDLATEVGSPRPELAELVTRLQALEDRRGPRDAQTRWQTQAQSGASPELWYGRSGLPLYGEHAGPWLAPSQLSAEDIKATVLDAVRATWPVPDDDDVAAPDEDIFAV